MHPLSLRVRVARGSLIMALAAASAADPVLPGALSTPGRLDASLAHESRAALDRGLAWLAGQQKPDGSWDGAGQPDLTALAVLAFKASPDPSHRPILKRGEACLARLPTNRGEAVWAVLALTQRLDRAAGLTSATAGTILFSRLRAGAGPADPVVQQSFAWIAAHPEIFRPETLTRDGYANVLMLAMALAQSGQNRIPLADHSLLPWRPLLAGALINRQKTDPETGGLYWPPAAAAAPADTLAATCYALLTLQVVLAE